ncbi:MAG: hypothetical protein NT069_26630 [Planctomycetota bacterium]|nr:hypothetical protein [Planctomycetota bacterium]
MRETTRDLFPGLRAWLLLAAVWVAGCGTKGSGPEFEDHLEYHVPPHRPASFSAGVDSIRDRLTRVTVGQSVGDDPELRRQSTELREIIEWLPELAGDSDMRKPQWDQVNEISQRLLKEYLRLESRPKVSTSELLAALLPMVESLDTLKAYDIPR